MGWMGGQTDHLQINRQDGQMDRQTGRDGFDPPLYLTRLSLFVQSRHTAQERGGARSGSCSGDRL